MQGKSEQGEAVMVAWDGHGAGDLYWSGFGYGDGYGYGDGDGDGYGDGEQEVEAIDED